MTAPRLVAAAVPGAIAAWLLPGGIDGALRALAAWHGERAVAVAAVGGDGVAVFAPEPPPARILAVPLARLAPDVYAPADAAPWPPAAPHELRDLLGDGVVVWLPGAPPRRVAPGPRARLAQMPTTARDWPTARPGVAAPRLREVVPEAGDPPPLSADGIGDGRPQDLPPDPDAPSRAQAMGRALASGVARGVGGLLRGLGASGVGRALDRFGERFGGRLDPLLERLRFDALHRLLDRLQQDPDDGLRHALPLADLEGSAGRGFAPPGWRLGTRSLDGGLHRQGGGAVDPWSVPEDLRRRLSRRYRELAAREEALGRHRRAAYILVHLLGDLPAAIAVLERGGWWRDAALILRDRLHRPRDAARCLERGGLLAEAARLYGRIGDDLAAGDCWQRLDDREQAQWHWRRHVDGLVRAGDALRAADLLQERMGALDEALALLAGTWPGHPQAGRCLEVRLGLLARHGRRAAALDLVAGLRGCPDVALPTAVAALAAVRAELPDPRLADEVADVGRALIGRSLQGSSRDVLDLLPRFAPGDRLVATDVARWRRRQAAPARARGPVGRLPDGVAWRAAVRVAAGLVLAGREAGDVVCARIGADGSARVVHRWPDPGPGEPHAFALAPGVHGDRVHLELRDGDRRRPLAPANLPTDDRWPRPLTVGTLAMYGAGVVISASDGAGGSLHLVATEGDTTLVHEAVATDSTARRIGMDLSGCAGAHLARLGERVVIAVDDGAALVGGEGLVGGIGFDHPVQRLLPVPDHAGMIAQFAHGDALACWPLEEDWLRVPLALPAGTALGFARDGLLIAAQPDRLKAFLCTDHRIVLRASAPGIGPVLAVVDLPTPEAVLLVTADRVVRWTIPELA